MTRWEYSEVTYRIFIVGNTEMVEKDFLIYGTPAKAITENVYNFIHGLGIDGWELIGFAFQGGETGLLINQKWIFKRPIKDSKMID